MHSSDETFIEAINNNDDGKEIVSGSMGMVAPHFMRPECISFFLCIQSRQISPNDSVHG